ncbi:hypothetical protein F8M41_022912 [Gigaspora margarita]|uniref:Uncharacterized protein n=1 Tax=Gigaspora margarita TaxID=4874 RepID=A0A8H4AEB9_GIGMA|nr:hypothetical protein F8M41_022912 [Gigaspora margarita]
MKKDPKPPVMMAPTMKSHPEEREEAGSKYIKKKLTPRRNTYPKPPVTMAPMVKSHPEEREEKIYKK